MAIDIRTRLPLVEPPQAAEEKEITPQEMLQELASNSEHIDKLLVMTMDDDGVLGFISNCSDLGDAVLFMELVKAQALFSRVQTPPTSPAPLGGGVA